MSPFKYHSCGASCMIECKKGTLDLVTVARIVLLLPPFLVIYLPRVQASPNVHERDGPKTDIHGRPNPQLVLAKSFNGMYNITNVFKGGQIKRVWPYKKPKNGNERDERVHDE